MARGNWYSADEKDESAQVPRLADMFHFTAHREKGDS